MTTATPSAVRKGGSWLLETTEPDAICTQERVSDEHRMMYKTALDFAVQEVMPLLPRLEAKEWALSRQLIRRAGELGLLGTDTPEEYGGLEIDKVSALVVAEGIARSASFTVTFGAMTGLAIMPLLLFGNTDFARVGKRSGPESVVIDGRAGLSALTDETILKVRARRAFAVANIKAWAGIEITNA